MFFTLALQNLADSSLSCHYSHVLPLVVVDEPGGEREAAPALGANIFHHTGVKLLQVTIQGELLLERPRLLVVAERAAVRALRRHQRVGRLDQVGVGRRQEGRAGLYGRRRHQRRDVLGLSRRWVVGLARRLLLGDEKVVGRLQRLMKVEGDCCPRLVLLFDDAR